MIAIDFETYYDAKSGYSLKNMGSDAYCRDPQFHIETVSVVGEGIKFSGTPDQFDWHRLHGKDLCAHNAGFDRNAFVVGGQMNSRQIPTNVVPASWTCTADLTAYLGCVRSLAKASNILLGRHRDKSIRDRMSGVSYRDACIQGWGPEYLEYCLQDSIDCLELWERFGDQWPEIEQKVSRYNRDECQRGVAVDVDALDEGMAHLATVLFDADHKIPWNWSDRKTPLSPKRMAEYCRSIGLPVPESTDRTTDACKQWLAAYGERHPFLQAMLDWRRANTMRTKLQSIKDRLRPDGTVPVELKYFGAHTGRFSGGGGVNMQNLNRGELMGVNMRWLIRPREGMAFFPADLSQIEPRTLAVLAGDKEFLKLIEHESPYEAHARLTMGWTGGTLKLENPALYQFAKARLLSLGYGAGWEKFISMAANQYLVNKDGTLNAPLFDSIFRRPVTGDEKMDFRAFLDRCKKRAMIRQFEDMPDADQRVWVNSWKQVADFRSTNPKITRLWKLLDHELRMSVGTRSREYTVELPSGRDKTYWQLEMSPSGDVKAATVRGAPKVHLHGGKLTENLGQAVSRDVFVEGYVALIEDGFHVPFTVHDENVVEAPEDTDPEKIAAHMRRRPDWFKSCPLEVEVTKTDRYTK